MAKSKLTGRPRRLPSPFDATAHKSERSSVAVLMHWMREIIEREGLDLGFPDVDTTGSDRKSPDIVIYESRSSQRVLCLIEAKPPYYNVLDEKNLKEPARLKATRRKAKYFGTTNFKHFIWYSTERVNAIAPEEKQVVDKYHLSELEDLDSLEDARYRDPIQRGLKAFLLRLYAVYTRKEAEPKLPVDEWLVFRLHEKIASLTKYYRPLIEDQCHKDDKFRKELAVWFNEQLWNFTLQRQDFDRAARQTAYLLINKILFYYILQSKRPHELSSLSVPEGLLKGAQLQKILQSFFDEVLKIDYNSIYKADFIDSLAFPDYKEIVYEIRDFVTVLGRYDFSKLGYDIIGRIFESLIPQNERHNFGQYFTSPDVVDIILRFCMSHESDKVLDPACGAGTFLVRAYQHKKMSDQSLDHESLLKTLWGTDIAKFPAHLATINLAINDLGVDNNYPNILQEDFFDLHSTSDGLELPRRAKSKGLKGEETYVGYPRYFDCIVGNPPYTRQEEIAKISEKDAAYKRKTIERALLDLKGKRLAEIGKRAGIHAYFFVHGMKFLRDGGHFGFVVSNSWMDVDYGKGLQEFFLKHYKIVAIIESKVERWFAEADVNTCIIILERCKNENERDENLVRFVYLKKPLRHFIPAAEDIWEKENARLEAIDRLKRTVLGHWEFYENEDLRIFPKAQRELFEEGYDTVEKAFIGAKWGKYLRAPEVFLKILDKHKSKFVVLKSVANVKRGFTTGADPWFYVTKLEMKGDFEQLKKLAHIKDIRGKKDDLCLVQSGDNTSWLVEKSFIHPVVRNPDKYKSIFIDRNSIDDFVVIIKEGRDGLKSKLIERYLLHGEKKAYKMGKERSLIPARTDTCSARQNWYQLPDLNPTSILWQKAFDICHRHYFVSDEVLANQRFYHIAPNVAEDTVFIAAFLNCPLVWLYLECQRSVMGLGAVESTVDEVKQISIANPQLVDSATRERIAKVFSVLGSREIGSVFEELGSETPEHVSLSKVKSDRREFDKIIMGEVLGLSDDEQLEVYRAVVDLVKFRIEKAQSVGKRGRGKEGIDIDALAKTILDKLGEETIGEFYKEQVLTVERLTTKHPPKLSGEFLIAKSLFGWKVTSGKSEVSCRSEEEARYLKLLFETGLTSVKVPKDDAILESLLPELEALKTKADAVLNSYLESIVDSKARTQIAHRVWSEVMK